MRRRSRELQALGTTGEMPPWGIFLLQRVLLVLIWGGAGPEQDRTADVELAVRVRVSSFAMLTGPVRLRRNQMNRFSWFVAGGVKTARPGAPAPPTQLFVREKNYTMCRG